MTHATGLPFCSTFDDLDLRPLCLQPGRQGQAKEPEGEIGVEALMDLVFQTLLPHPASYQAVCDALRQWYHDFHPRPQPQPA